ncbi:MAG: Hrp-dependent type effector protein, partial [Paenibacillus sp.]|nr:Hrp-dependent type effector protein [Paenibacillus sp.]
HIVWAGSAGLANCLPISNDHVIPSRCNEGSELAVNDPVLLVVGSVNGQSRKQLDALLNQHPVISAVKLQSHAAVEGGTARGSELSRIIKEAEQDLLKGLDVVLFSSGDKADIDKANEVGRQSGLTDPTAVSQRIAETLGEAAAYLMNRCPLQGVVLTGGDTAKQVCLHWGASRFELMDEVESGIPRGRLIGGKPGIFAVTKAGGFGSEQVLIRAIGRLRKEESTTG